VRDLEQPPLVAGFAPAALAEIEADAGRGAAQLVGEITIVFLDGGHDRAEVAN
jgi:hypothetical protein